MAEMMPHGFNIYIYIFGLATFGVTLYEQTIRAFQNMVFKQLLINNTKLYSAWELRDLLLEMRCI